MNIDITVRYERAAALECGEFGKSVAFNTTVYPHWIEGTSTFWYVREARHGQTYRLVDAKAGLNRSAFDHHSLACALTEASGEAVEADNLSLEKLTFSEDLSTCTFAAFSKTWVYDIAQKTCQEESRLPEQWRVSPDGRKAAFVRDHNLWVRDLSSGDEKPLTHDGERYNDYALSQPLLSHGYHQPSVSVEALWSPDSRSLFTVLIDIRKVEIGPPLVQHVPTDGSLRPKILRADRRVAFPGDKHIPTYQLLAIDVDSGKNQFANYPPCPIHYPPYSGYFSGYRGWWDSDSRHGYFVDVERGGKTLNLVKFDTHTGATEQLFQETSEHFVTLMPISHTSTLILPLPESNELIWFSERSGTAHLYLYELASGKLKNPITQGDWLVRNVLHFDAKRRELTIQTAGRKRGRNPYYCDICRVNIDSGQITDLVSSDHEYVVTDQRSRISLWDKRAAGVSPCGEYVVTTRSRVDDVPVSLLLSRNGKEILTLETADISGLPENWQWPEPVMLKAADGKTDIMGVVFRPSDFDPQQSYPVLDCTYGYVSPVGAFTNSHVQNRQYLSPAACAELGFIAVVIHNRGKDGLRDVAFNTYQDPHFPEVPLFGAKAPKGDCVAGIKQLAERYSYIDLNRVGVIETGSQPQALAGMLSYPDFYKVGVSACSVADARMLAAQGMNAIDDNAPKLEDLAGNFQGKLLIVTGMLEWACPVAMPFRLIEALQKANKRFDTLILPNLSHSRNGYVIQRSWDYLVQHLLSVEPPDDFRLITDRDLSTEQEVKTLEGEYN